MAKKEVIQTESEGLRFLKAEMENFKDVSKKIVDIDGRSLIVFGGNGEGKSTFIQALTSPLDVKTRPSMPIKTGETHSSISVTLGGSVNGEKREYILELYFSPKNSTGRLVVTDMEGAKLPNPAGFIKGLIGQVSLDVMSWVSDTKEKRLQKLKDLTGISKELDVLNIDIKAKKSEKSKKKERAEDLEAILKNHNFSQEEIDKYSSPIDLLVLQTEMTTISASQDKFDAAIQKIKDIKKSISNNDEIIVKSTDEINRLKVLILSEETKIANASVANVDLIVKSQAADKWLETAIRPSSAEISQRMVDANIHNEKCNSISVLASQSKEMMKYKDEVMVSDTDIKKLEKLRSDKIASSQLPIEHLTFDDEEIYYKGIPLEKGDVNTATLIDVSIQMAIHQLKKSNLKCIFIHDASLLDKNTMKKIVNEIEANDIQVIAEVVDWNAGEMQVKFTEDIL